MDTSPGRRRRVWPDALKREIVAAASAPGASVSVVARQYDVNTNLVFTWRRFYRGLSTSAAPQLVPVTITPDPPVTPPPAAPEAIEIELPRGYRVRVGAGAKAATLRLVLDALERR